MNNTKMVDVSYIKIGDTIMIHGQPITVGKDTVKRGFMGTTINGERVIGKVEQVLFIKWYKGVAVGLVAQI